MDLRTTSRRRMPNRKGEAARKQRRRCATSDSDARWAIFALHRLFALPVGILTLSSIVNYFVFIIPPHHTYHASHL